MLVVILLLFFISFLIFILLLFFILFPGYFTMSPALHPGFSCPWRPSTALSSTPTTFDYLFFFIYNKRYGFEWAFFGHRRFLPYAPARHFWHNHKRYGFEWAFFTHRHFLPYAPSQHFWHNLLLSRPSWEPAVLPWSLQGFILILKTQTRPICLFDSQ